MGGWLTVVGEDVCIVLLLTALNHNCRVVLRMRLPVLLLLLVVSLKALESYDNSCRAWPNYPVTYLLSPPQSAK